MLHELPGPAGQPADDRILEGAQLVQIDRRLAEFDAPRRRVPGLGDHLGDVQQRLRGDAAAIDAHAAGVVFRIDEDDLQAEVRGEKRRRISARSAADDSQLSGDHGQRLCIHEVTKTRRSTKIFFSDFVASWPPCPWQYRRRSAIHPCSAKQKRLLQRFDDPAEEADAVGAVHDPVVVGQRQRQHEARHELRALIHRLDACARDAEDRRLPAC